MVRLELELTMHDAKSNSGMGIDELHGKKAPGVTATAQRIRVHLSDE